MADRSRLCRLAWCAAALVALACVPRPLVDRPAAAPGVVVFALLADNRLVAVDPESGATVAIHALAPAPTLSTGLFTGHYLALSAVGSGAPTLHILVAGSAQTADRVVTVDAGTASVRATYTLAGEGGVYRGLAVGPRSGHLYLFGSRSGDAVVTVLDAAARAVVATLVARPSDGRTWLVHQGAVSADERYLFVSYHGPDTTGIDRFEITGDGLVRCGPPPAALPGSGCIGAHGGFALWGNGLLVATGSPVVLEVDASGAVRRGFDTGQAGNHLMDFAVDLQRQRLYAVGSCGYRGGYSAVDLQDGGVPTTPTVPGEWRWAATPTPAAVSPSRSVCGERLALDGQGRLVVGQLPQPVPQLGAPGALLVLEPSSGRLIRSVPLPAAPLDVLPGTGVPLT